MVSPETVVADDAAVVVVLAVVSPLFDAELLQASSARLMPAIRHSPKTIFSPIVILLIYLTPLIFHTVRPGREPLFWPDRADVIPRHIPK